MIDSCKSYLIQISTQTCTPRLPQLSALLAALRGTSGCVIISSKAATLCIGVHGQRQLHEHIISEGDDLDEDDDDVVLVR